MKLWVTRDGEVHEVVGQTHYDDMQDPRTNRWYFSQPDVESYDSHEEMYADLIVRKGWVRFDGRNTYAIDVGRWDRNSKDNVMMGCAYILQAEPNARGLVFQYPSGNVVYPTGGAVTTPLTLRELTDTMYETFTQKVSKRLQEETTHDAKSGRRCNKPYRYHTEGGS